MALFQQRPDLIRGASGIVDAFFSGQNAGLRQRQLKQQQQQLSAQAEQQKAEMEARRQQVLQQRQAQQVGFINRAVQSGRLDPARATALLQEQGVDVDSVFGGQVPQSAEEFGLRSELFAGEQQRQGIQFKDLPPEAKLAVLSGDEIGSLEFQKRMQSISNITKTDDQDKRESMLRKEFQGTKTFKDAEQVAIAASKVRHASPTAAGDLNLVFGFMKLIDPGSTVRESEAATVENAAGVPDRIRTLWNRTLEGEKLAPPQRANFKAEARRLLAAQTERYEQFAGQYRKLAKEAGLDPDDVVLDIGLKLQKKAQGKRPTVKKQDKQKLDQANALFRKFTSQGMGREEAREEVIKFMRSRG